MKNFSKYLIKLLYVLIIPAIVSYVFIEVLSDSDTLSGESFLFMLIIWVITIFNALFWVSKMSRTHLLPKIKCQWNTGFGIYLRKVNFHWELDLPLFTIIFQRRK